MSDNVLVINCGSSSLKFALFDIAQEQELIAGLAERLGDENAQLSWSVNGEKTKRDISNADHKAAITAVMVLLKNLGLDGNIKAVGHRVVHGAEVFRDSCIIEAKTLAAINDCVPLAPLHNPGNIIGIEAIAAAMPALPQVAVFDTSFHQTIPKHAYLYPVPYSLYKDHGVRRYGFHGTSHSYVCEQAAIRLEVPLSETALLSVHLGNGCSATAVLGGESQDTTMGMTPLEGLVMGTRSGNVDPGLHQYLADTCGYSLAEITDLLNKKSGLLGLSELSNDMRELTEAAEAGHEGAILAIDVFCYQLAKQLASLTVALGRLDALVFTGGIGENAPSIREKTCALLSIFNVQIDQQRNGNSGKSSNGFINAEGSTPNVLVVSTNEELKIALDTARVCLNG